MFYVFRLFRYIYVCHLTTARTWCTVPRVCRAMVIIFIMAFIHQSTRFADRDYTSVDFMWNNSRRTGCQFETAKWVCTQPSPDCRFFFNFHHIFDEISDEFKKYILYFIIFRYKSIESNIVFVKNVI